MEKISYWSDAYEQENPAMKTGTAIKKTDQRLLFRCSMQRFFNIKELSPKSVLEFEKFRSIYMFLLISTIGICVLVAMGIFALKENRTILGVLDLSLAVILAFNIIHARCKKNFLANIYVGITSTALLFIFAFLAGGENNSSFVWYFTFPLIASSLLGSKKGALSSALIFIPALALFVVKDLPPLFAHYSLDLKLRFTGAFFVVTSFSYFFEYSRERNTKELQKTHHDLQHTVEQLQEAKEAAEAASRAKSRFLANMSHEIRTPLNGVLGMTDLLMNSVVTEKQRRFVETIRLSGQTLLSVINDILDFSKIEAGKLELETVDFNLRETIEDIVGILADMAQRKGIELICNIHPDVPLSVKGDPGRLGQILTNLVSNAIKFTEKGEIEVKVTASPAESDMAKLQFEIRDTGVGISPDARRRIFDAFAQEDESTTRRYGGTGLGLAIAKQLSEMMGGSIGVESEPGRGSRFWFTITLKKQRREESVSPAQFNDLRGVRILIVDDNSTNRSILHDQITAWGMSNGSAENGQKALELLTAAAKRGTPYDLAVVDMNMPGMNGIELARAIKKDPVIAPVRLIMLTSVGYLGDYEEALNSGFLSYLSKPVRQSQLYNCLLNVMNEPAEIIPQKKCANAEPVKKCSVFHGNVLLAEDNLVNQEVTRGFLESLGCQVDIVGNGREAVEALSRKSYDLIFMDCQMPEMDGFEATRSIREREKNDNGRHVPIIALTAHALEGDREACLAADMDDYLAKPFTPEQLREKLELWIKEELHAIT